jgi:hypothetical protein
VFGAEKEIIHEPLFGARSFLMRHAGNFLCGNMAIYGIFW